MCAQDILRKGHVTVKSPAYRVNVSTVMRDGDPYDGSYEITPDASEHVLVTRGKLLSDNVTVNAAPSGSVSVSNLGMVDDDGHVTIMGQVDVTEGWVTNDSTTRSYEFDKREVSFTPTERTQSMAPTVEHEFISRVTVNPIPEQYLDSSECTASPDAVLAGEYFIGASGFGVGAMPNNGDTGGVIDTVDGTHAIPHGHTSGGTVSLGNVSECVPGNIRKGVSILGVDGNVIVPTVSQSPTTYVLSIS